MGEPLTNDTRQLRWIVGGIAGTLCVLFLCVTGYNMHDNWLRQVEITRMTAQGFVQRVDCGVKTWVKP